MWEVVNVMDNGAYPWPPGKKVHLPCECVLEIGQIPSRGGERRIECNHGHKYHLTSTVKVRMDLMVTKWKDSDDEPSPG